MSEIVAVRRAVVFGCGYAGSAIAKLARARGLDVVATARGDEKVRVLGDAGYAARRFDPMRDDVSRFLGDIDAHTLVAICFPPDGRTDALVAPWISKAAILRYVSSTSVYGTHAGLVDDATLLPPPERDSVRMLLQAETCWRNVGATVLRSAAIYGPDRGLCARVVRGEHRIPGDGTRFMSRIHVDDLAEHVLSPVAARGETFVVGDENPAPHGEVVRFIAEQYGVPVPPSVPLESVHSTLRADRRVDAARARRILRVSLRYPSYREGMAPAATRFEPYVRRCP